MGRNSIVGTTVKKAEFLPEHVVADEKHSRQKSGKVYIATTVAQGCIVGSALTSAANTEALTEAYKDFKEEAQNIAPEYQPKTVNTDGWEATHYSEGMEETLPHSSHNSLFSPCISKNQGSV